MTVETGVPLRQWTVEVYIPSLVSREPCFRQAGPNDPLLYAGQLYVTGADLMETMRQTNPWPPEARVLTRRIGLKHTEPDGETFIERKPHEVVHGERIKFVLASPHLPPYMSWRPWVLKKITEVLDGST